MPKPKEEQGAKKKPPASAEGLFLEMLFGMALESVFLEERGPFQRNEVFATFTFIQIH